MDLSRSRPQHRCAGPTDGITASTAQSTWLEATGPPAMAMHCYCDLACIYKGCDCFKSMLRCCSSRCEPYSPWPCLLLAAFASCHPNKQAGGRAPLGLLLNVLSPWILIVLLSGHTWTMTYGNTRLSWRYGPKLSSRPVCYERTQLGTLGSLELQVQAASPLRVGRIDSCTCNHPWMIGPRIGTHVPSRSGS